jgi:hypothetical protein
LADKLPHFVSKVPTAKWAVNRKFIGEWSITQLEGFDAEYLNLCGPSVIKISPGGIGEMNFGAVEIVLDCKMDDLNEHVLRFSFEGSDEGDPISGRGYSFNEGREMTGRIFLYCGDEFGFKAKKIKKVGRA